MAAWVTGYVLKINYYDTALIITFTVHLNLKLDSADKFQSNKKIN